jgi:hypothetical protein
MGNSIIKRFQAAFRAFSEGFSLPGTGVDSDDYLYRRLGSKERDLSPVSHSRQQEIAAYLFDANPMCKRLVKMQAEYIVSEGWTVRSDDTELEDFLLSFWNHPVNNIDMNLIDFAREFSIFGEQCYQIFVEEFTGSCQIGYIDPTTITAVVHTRNPLLVDYVMVKGQNGTEDHKLDGVKFVYGQRSSMNAKPSLSVSGDTFFFKNNAFICSTRGRSDYIGVFEVLDLYNTFIFSRCDRSILANNVVHDVTIEGASEQDAKDFVRKNTPIVPNMMFAHNEQIKYDVKSPNLRAEDASFEDKTIRNYLLGSFGFPEHFFGSGGDTNRATAMEMHEPVVRMLKNKQRIFANQFRRVIEFVKYHAKIRGLLTDKAYYSKYEIEYPEVSYRDMQRSGLTMMYLAQSLAIAVERSWLTDRDAAELYSSVASGFGPNIDPNPDLKDSKAAGLPDEEPDNPGTVFKMKKTGGQPK